MRTPKNVASSMNAVKVSYIRSGPWIGPDILASSLQLVPNWNAITIPDDSQSERHAEYLQPEVEDHAIDRPAGRKTQRLQNGEPRCQSDREGRKDDMERDGKGKLNSR